MNSDKYPDIAVGAYLSEQVVLIKSKPAITLLTTLIYTDKKKLLRNSTSFLIDACTFYNGINAPTHIRKCTIKILRYKYVCILMNINVFNKLGFI